MKERKLSFSSLVGCCLAVRPGQLVMLYSLLSLPQCRSDLKSDEEIFAEKSREVKQLAEQLQDMVSEFLDFNVLLAAQCHLIGVSGCFVCECVSVCVCVCVCMRACVHVCVCDGPTQPGVHSNQIHLCRVHGCQ